MHTWLVGLPGQFAAGGVHLLPYILQGLVRVKTGVEFQHHRGVAFGAGAAHLLDTFQ